MGNNVVLLLVSDGGEQFFRGARTVGVGFKVEAPDVGGSVGTEAAKGTGQTIGGTLVPKCKGGNTK